MRKICRLVLSVILSALLIGCSEGESSITEITEETAASVDTAGVSETTTRKKRKEKVKETRTEPVTEPVSYDIGTDIPVISINTKNQSEDVMDFITEPVSLHVAESIASWTPGYRMPPEPYYEACTVTVTGTDDVVTLDSVDAEVKVRGNWTTTYEKKPLRIKFTEKQNILGLNDGAQMKNWVLLAEYKDGSMLRNKVSMSMAEEILSEDGLYTGDTEFVEVEVNGQYWGVYLLTEMQQINPDRIDITEAEKGYTGTDIGYFMEFDGYFVDEQPLNSLHIGYADNSALIPFEGDENSERTVKCLNDVKTGNKSDIGITVKSDINSQEQHNFIENYMDNVYKIMYYAAYNNKAYEFNQDFTEISESDALTPQEAVEKAVNVQSLADMYIVSERTCDADIYWSSFFMDVDFGAEGDKKLTYEAPWDFDSGLGNKDRCADGTGFYAASIVPDVNNQYKTINPWLAVLIQEKWFQDIIREKWTKAYDAGVFERTFEMISSDTEQYKDAFTRNYQRWNNLADKSAYEGELSRDSAKCKTHAEASEHLLGWLTARVKFLNDYWHS